MEFTCIKARLHCLNKNNALHHSDVMEMATHLVAQCQQDRCETMHAATGKHKPHDNQAHLRMRAGLIRSGAPPNTRVMAQESSDQVRRRPCDRLPKKNKESDRDAQRAVTAANKSFEEPTNCR